MMTTGASVGSDASGSRPPGSLRIVVAEDEAIIRLDLVEMLAEEGYEVVGEASRGDDAIELVRTLRPDLAIFDIKMPGLDGVSAARVVADEGLSGVVVLTAFSQRDLIESARDAGVLAYLLKPFQKPELVAAIEVAVARHRDRKRLSDEVHSLEDRLATRKVIDRAKAILLRHGLSEAEAFAEIQRSAMNSRSTMKDVAQAIVDRGIVDRGIVDRGPVDRGTGETIETRNA
jgi:two-component system, response regulator PdtaR